MSTLGFPEKQAVLLQAEKILQSTRNTEGGWGYGTGQPSQTEPTALALIALNCLKNGANSTPSDCNALLRLQDAAGAFRIPHGFSKAYWPTALAAITLQKIHCVELPLQKTIGWLLTQRSRTKDMNEELARDFEIDTSLAGWSWTEDTFSWVDPTAWVVLALRHAGYGEHPRVKEGLRLLLDRAYAEGGANCGNRRIYGSKTEPVPANTCHLLLAHAGLADDPKLAAARAYLRQSIQVHEDLENLCWIMLALRAWPNDQASQEIFQDLEAKILALFEEQKESNRVFSVSVVRQALAILALHAESDHPFVPPEKALKVSSVESKARRSRGIADRIGSTFRGLMVAAAGQLRALPDSTFVHIARAATYDEDLAAIVGKQYESFRARLPLKDKRVVIKPNLVEYHPHRVINTNPQVIGAVIALCQREGAKEIIVAEGPGHWRNVQYLVTASGLKAVLEKYQVHFVDVNNDKIAPRVNLGMLTGMEHIYYSATVAEADVLISMPKLKTHHWAGVTLSLKNLFGTLPGLCYGWPKNELHHRGIENSIVDIALTRTPELAVIDGIIGMEGDGPLNGQAKPVGAIIMGIDPLAVDATGARLMGFDPEQIGHLKLGSIRRLGHLSVSRIQQVGEPIDALKQAFKPPPKLERIVAGG